MEVTVRLNDDEAPAKVMHAGHLHAALELLGAGSNSTLPIIVATDDQGHPTSVSAEWVMPKPAPVDF